MGLCCYQNAAGTDSATVLPGNARATRDLAWPPRNISGLGSWDIDQSRPLQDAMGEWDECHLVFLSRPRGLICFLKDTTPNRLPDANETNTGFPRCHGQDWYCSAMFTTRSYEGPISTACSSWYTHENPDLSGTKTNKRIHNNDIPRNMHTHLLETKTALFQSVVVILLSWKTKYTCFSQVYNVIVCGGFICVRA